MSPFQVQAMYSLKEFAASIQLEAYPILGSGNGTEYKNYIQRTVFTVYHQCLDPENEGRIEIAIGFNNISDEFDISIPSIEAWYSEAIHLLLPAKSKPPFKWPRLSLRSKEEVDLFRMHYAKLANATSELNQSVTSINPCNIDEVISSENLSRRGQQQFRERLMNAYERRCAISGCQDVEVLEAAHIEPHSKTQNYQASNGLILRADIHKLFDLHLITIDPSSALVSVSKQLGETYQCYNGVQSMLPRASTNRPDPTALMQHFSRWKAKEESSCE